MKPKQSESKGVIGENESSRTMKNCNTPLPENWYEFQTKITEKEADKLKWYIYKKYGVCLMKCNKRGEK